VSPTIRVLSLAAIIVAVAAPLYAHHSFGAEYDVNQPVTVSGVVTKIEWTNPHSFVFVDVADGNGSVTNWKFEGYPPNALYRTGWKRDVSMKPGDAVLYEGVHHRHGRTDPNPNRWSAHLFLHWVDRDGPYRDHAFDGRAPAGVDFQFV